MVENSMKWCFKTVVPAAPLSVGGYSGVNTMSLNGNQIHFKRQFIKKLERRYRDIFGHKITVE
jgi:hypothetical protein